MLPRLVLITSIPIMECNFFSHQILILYEIEIKMKSWKLKRLNTQSSDEIEVPTILLDRKVEN